MTGSKKSVGGAVRDRLWAIADSAGMLAEEGIDLDEITYEAGTDRR